MTDSDGVRSEAVTDRPATSPKVASDVVVTAHGSAPGRTVLTELGNTDGWMASSLMVDCLR